jgi:predicted nuclease with RNAse H fold
MGDVLGLHLVAHLGLVSSPRRSVVARLGADGRLQGLETAAGDDEIAALVAARDASLIVVDAPLEVPPGGGRRDAEAILAWCDVAAFPVSARRLETVYGGARGVALRPALTAGGRRALEALPDQVLRQIVWERDHPPQGPPMDLAAYRAAWIGVRAPRYRPKGEGRARPAGILEAWGVLAEAVDLCGWAPSPAPDDWAAIADAAVIDAVLCAYAGLRLARGTGVTVGAPGRGVVALAAGADLRDRLDATVARLASEGTIVP